MTDTPERIWRVKPYIPIHASRGLASWPTPEDAGEGATEYIKADHANAMVAVAIEAAKSAVLHNSESDAGDNRIWKSERPYICEENAYLKIAPLTPTDAQTALDALIEAERAKCAALVEALQTVSAIFQAEMHRSGGKPFSGEWSIPKLNIRITCNAALDAADAALAAYEEGL